MLARGGSLEERRTDGSVGGLVDDLVAAATRDKDRRIEVRTEVLERIYPPDRRGRALVWATG